MPEIRYVSQLGPNYWEVLGDFEAFKCTIQSYFPSFRNGGWSETSMNELLFDARKSPAKS